MIKVTTTDAEKRLWSTLVLTREGWSAERIGDLLGRKPKTVQSYQTQLRKAGWLRDRESR